MKTELHVDSNLLHKFLACCEVMDYDPNELIEELMTDYTEEVREYLSDYAPIFQ